MSTARNTARSLNARFATSLGWGTKLPVSYLIDVPDLNAPFASAEFARGVSQVQRMLWPNEPAQWDGVLGTRTWERMLEALTAVPGQPGFVMHGVASRTLTPLPQLITYLDQDGLNLQVRGDYSRSPDRKLKRIVLHWGGFDAPSCFRALANQGLSSHFGVDRTRVYQWLDLEVTAWHAGKAGNTDSIGIDICQAAVGARVYAKHSDDGLRALRYTDNPSGRGERRCFPLDSRTAQTTRELVRALCAEYDIPYVTPGHHGVLPAAELADFRGVIGHHHISARKWDVAPWWDTIFPHGELL